MFLPAYIIAPLDFQCIIFISSASSASLWPVNKSQSSRNKNIRMACPYQLLKNYDFLSSQQFSLLSSRNLRFSFNLLLVLRRKKKIFNRGLVLLKNAAVSSSSPFCFYGQISLQKHKPYFHVFSTFSLTMRCGLSLNTSDFSWFWW